MGLSPLQSLKNRNVLKRVNDVGVYVKDFINNNVRNDVVSTDETLNHLWIEVQRKNKKSPYLTGMVYETSSQNAKESDCIDVGLSSVKTLEKVPLNRQEIQIFI